METKDLIPSLQWPSRQLGTPLRSRVQQAGLVYWLLAIMLVLAWTPDFSQQVLAQAEGEAGPAGEAARKPKPLRRVGWLLRVPVPITGNIDDRVIRMVQTVLTQRAKPDEQPVLVFEFQSQGQDEGRGSNFGRAYNLARTLTQPEFARAWKVAYIPRGITVTGHAVLPVLACDEIVMEADAQIGKSGIDETTVTPEIRDVYVRTAATRGIVPKALVLGMLDPALEVLQVETDVGHEFILKEELEALRKERAVQVKAAPVVRAGEWGLFSGAQARELGFVSRLVEDRASLSRALALETPLEEDPSLDGSQWQPLMVKVKGPLTPRELSRIQRMIEDGISQGDANLICVWLDSDGGAPHASYKLADYLASLNPSTHRTVAFVAGESRGDAAFIALACDQIVLQSGASLGGEGAMVLTQAETAAFAVSMKHLGERKGRSQSLMEAFVREDLSLHLYTRAKDGMKQVFSEAEAADAMNGPEAEEGDNDWVRTEAIGEPGETLRLNATAAKELGLAYNVVSNFREFRDNYGLEQDPRLVEPGWVDHLVDLLASPWISWLLLLFGAMAVYVEAKTPGIGLGGILGGLCFLVFFWAKFLGGTAEWLEIILFLVGIGLLLVEIFVLPGFGVFGVVGALCVVSSVIFASQTFFIPRNEYQLREFRDSLATVTAAAMGMIGVASMLRKFLPNTPMLNNVILEPPTNAEREAIAQNEHLVRFEHLLGQQGKTTTKLLPGGKAQFGNEIVQVLSDGEVLDANISVEVTEVRGNMIFVRQV